ncbi:MAG TPA: hypothetical protein VK960_03560 [Acidimicrobiia bacterium]|nr:hypothetical protein [Acidimicrobiia bacterium]
MSSEGPDVPRRSIWRRIERRFVGFWMSLVLWFVERRLLKDEQGDRG